MGLGGGGGSRVGKPNDGGDAGVMFEARCVLLIVKSELLFSNKGLFSLQNYSKKKKKRLAK